MAEVKVRESSFHGKFYPDSTEEIGNMLDVLSEKAGDPGLTSKPSILILPHAGWIYSGLAAVKGIKTLSGSPPNRIVLIGPSHRHYFLGFSPAEFDVYRTPLGDVNIDHALDQELKDITGFEYMPEAHSAEHSLEVIVPMLQHFIPNTYKILPVLAGSVGWGDIKKMADALASILDPLSDTLIISTDLSHFFNYEEARELDTETMNMILDGKDRELAERAGKDGSKICGFTGVLVAMNLARTWDLGAPELLIYYNSGDATGDRQSVVGYASMAWPQPSLVDSN